MVVDMVSRWLISKFLPLYPVLFWNYRHPPDFGAMPALQHGMEDLPLRGKGNF